MEARSRQAFVNLSLSLRELLADAYSDVDDRGYLQTYVLWVTTTVALAGLLTGRQEIHDKHQEIEDELLSLQLDLIFVQVVKYVIRSNDSPSFALIGDFSNACCYCLNNSLYSPDCVGRALRP